MKYLVTGGCGFIGSHLCDALIMRGHSVRVLDDLSTGKVENLSDEAQLIEGDVADPQCVKEAMEEVDGCFHLAAVASVERSFNDWSGTHRINQSGTINVLESARNGKTGVIPVVYASSAAVYGDNAMMPLAEAALPRPISAYGADKLGSEFHARVAWLAHGIPTVGMRFFNVYGPRQDPNSPYSGVISIFVDRILNQQVLKIFGNGKQTRDFIYVSDVVDYLMAAMDNPGKEASVYNLCTGFSTSINQLAQVLSMLAGQPLLVDYQPARSGDIAISLGDPIRAQKRYGFAAGVELGEGLRRTLAHLRQPEMEEYEQLA